MYKALLYKEFLKTRKTILALALVSIATHIYMYAKIERSMRLVGIDHLWEVIIGRNIFLFSAITVIPLVAGIAIGLSQFVPELRNKSLRLSLHLPVKESATVATFVGYGTIVNVALSALSLVSLTIFASIYFPWEITQRVIQTTYPWFAAGLCAYAITAWICLEPTWTRRAVNGLIGAGLVNLMFITSDPGAYSQAIGLVALIAILPYAFIAESIVRFKQGVQD